MAKSIVVDRVKVIARMARLDITGEELAPKRLVLAAAQLSKCGKVKLCGVPLRSTSPALWAWTWPSC